MKSRLLIAALIILTVVLIPYLIPTDGRVIILIWRYKIELQIYLALAITLATILTLHWLLRIQSWLRQVPSRIWAYRQSKQNENHTKYRAQALEYLLEKDYTRATQYFAFATKTHYQTSLDYLATAYCALHNPQPDLESAKKNLANVDENGQYMAQHTLLQALVYKHQGKPHLAIEHLQRLPEAKRAPESQELLEKLYVETKQWHCIQTLVTNALKTRAPKITPWIIEKLMQQQIIAEETENCIRLFERLPSQFKLHQPLVTQYTLALFTLGQIEKAIDTTLSYLSSHPNIDILHQVSYFCGTETNRSEKTLEKLKNLQKRQPKNVFIPLALGLLYKNTHRYSDALEHLKEAYVILNEAHGIDDMHEEEKSQLRFYCLREQNYCLAHQTHNL